MHTRSFRRAAVCVIGALIAVLLPAQPASAAGQFLWWSDDGAETRTVGANSGVYIYMGAIDFACDFIFPAADVYVVAGTPSDGAALVDAGGGSNTILGAGGGLFIDELIAVTAPSGKLGEGTYSVVYDECQDGKYNANRDALFANSLIVDFPPGPIPPINPAIGQMKADAQWQAATWLLMTGTLDTYEKLQELKSNIECVISGLIGCGVQKIIDGIKEAGTQALMDSLGLVDPKKAARDAVDDLSSYYLGIAADPPDPAFAQLSTLQPVPTIQPLTGAAYEKAKVALGNAAGTDAALAEALLRSIERYQGADAANNNEWALAHARAIQSYATLLSDSVVKTNAALTGLRTTLNADARDFNRLARDFEPFRQRLSTSGFTADEQATLDNLGLSPAQQAAVRTDLTATPMGAFTEAGLSDNISTVVAANTAMRGHLQQLAANVDDIINTIKTDPNLADNGPRAEAAGPYAGAEGAPLSLNGAGSTDPGGAISTYEWDLDRDGAFDDATGPTPAVTFPVAFDGLIGLRVTDPDGNRAVDYAVATIGDANRAPVIGATTPPDRPRLAEVGTTVPFSASATDADGDAFSSRWLVDGIERGSGSTFAYGPLAVSDVGAHTVEVVVSDGNPAGASRFQWGVQVLLPDGDGDGWRSNTDCADNDASVNPGRPEEQGNLKDDDCDPATSDAVVNDPPVAAPVSTGTLEDSAVEITLPASDPESDPLEFLILTGPTHGTLSSVVGGKVTYTPATNFNGADSFTYRVREVGGDLLQSSIATVAIDVAPVVDPLNAADVAAATQEDTAVPVTLNAVDQDGGTPAYTIVSAPTRGTLSAVSGNQVTYTPTANLNGTDSFTYRAASGSNVSNVATVTVAVGAVNDAPTAVNRVLTLAEDTALAVPLAGTDVDGDALSFLVVNGPLHGTLSAVSGGSVTYTPAANFSGTDSFTYKSFDGGLTSSAASVALTVTPVNDVPAARPVDASTGEDQPVEIALHGTDVEGTPLLYTIVSPPAHGTLSAVNGLRVTYTPAAEYSGPDSFTYRVGDGVANSAAATVTLAVNAMNDAPVAFDDATSTANNGAVEIDVLANDTDVDGGAKSVVALTTPTSGTADVLPDNRVRFTPPYDFSGVTNFSYTVSDGAGGLDQGTVTVVSTDAPVATKTWTNRTQFSTGSTVNVVQHGVNQLKLDDQSKAANRLWVAVSSKGTIVKIDTDTGKIIGEYFSSPAGQPRDPSRTTVDLNGNVWASNRAGNSVLHIGLVENNQCRDRNGNGTIETSTGQNNILAWTNAGGANTNGGVTTAADECIIHYTRVNSSGTRHVSVNAQNDVWVSGTGGQRFDLVDGDTGLIIRAEPSVGYGGYGGLIDGNNVIWSAGPAAAGLLRWPTSGPLTGPNGGNWRGISGDAYGLCIDPNDGTIWNAALNNDRIRKFAPDGTLLGSFPHGYYYAQGCVVDKTGDVWVANSLYGNTVGHLKKNGTFVGNVVVQSGPTGVAVDGAGKVWATNYNSGTVSRIDPTKGPVGGGGSAIGQVDFTTVNLGGNPYNYSDMTGSTLTGAPSVGNWTAVYDSGTAGTDWDRAAWTAEIPAGTGITVTSATSENGTTFTVPQAVSSGAAVPSPNGRYIRLNVSFARPLGAASPVLSDLSVWAAPPAPPVATPGSETTLEDTPVELDLQGVSPKGTPLTSYVIGAGPGHGTLTRIDGTRFTYTPDADYHGADDFYFRVNDGSLNSDVAAFTLEVTPVNDAPVAADLSLGTPEDVSIEVGLAATDVEGDALTFSVVDAPAHGTLSAVSGGLVTYTPAADYHGPDSFTYRANDGALDSNLATVAITVSPVNDAPVASDISLGTDEDVALPVTLVGSDVDGDALSFVIVSPPTHGSLSAVSGGSVTYTPEADYHGPDAFTYRANDGALDSNVASVTISVGAVNDAPVAADVAVGTDEDVPAALQLLGSDVDGDALSFVVISGPAHGTLSAIAGDSVIYTPDPNYHGPDSFTYRANDGALDSNVASVTITVAPVNDAPVASDVSVGTDEDTGVPVGLLGSDVDGDALSFAVVTGPEHGTLSAVSGSSVVYTPDPNYHGPDSFTYRANDGALDSDLATVTITVAPVNDPPVAASFSTSTPENVPTTVILAATDVDGDATSFAIVTGPAHGTLGPITGDSVVYTPATGYSGPDSFTYRANDGQADSNVATVSITVIDTNDPPNCSTVVADPSRVLWSPNHKFVPIRLSGATDPDGDQITWRIVTVTQDESVTEKGSGSTSPDARRDSADTVSVRAERAGGGDGRVYRIGFTVTDTSGESCTGQVSVGVPHDQGGKQTPVDSGGSYNSFG